MSFLGRAMMGAAVLLLLSARIGAHAAWTDNARPFTVEDSIAWTTVLNFEGDFSANPASGTVLPSPDGAHFLVHTHRGVLSKNVNVEALLLFRAEEVERYLVATQEAPPPRPRTLLEIEIAQDAGAMSSIQWIADREIGFLAEDDNGCKQAFVADINSGSVSQLTHSETPVASFAVAGDAVLFYAHSKVQPLSQVEVAGDRTVQRLIFPDAKDTTALELFQMSRSTGAARKVDLPRMRLLEGLFDRIWIAPSGEWAVTFIPAANAPAHWAQYQLYDYGRNGYTLDRVNADPASAALLFRTRYALVDLKRNAVKPLLDGPSGWMAMNETPFEVFWPSDGRSVIVSNTYMPLKGVDARSAAQRATRPAVAEVNLVSGEVVPVLWESGATDAERAAGRRRGWSIKTLRWDEAQGLVVVKDVRRDSDGKAVYSGSMEDTTIVREIERWKKRNGVWRTISYPAEQPGIAKFTIDLHQGLNERPKVYVTSADGVRKLLFDPNPQAEGLLFGRIEAIGWTDPKYGLDWSGGVVYPPDYVAGRRYPLVVQTHGFDPDQFLLDGPGGGTGVTAMAAQALANAGFVVLQVNDRAVGAELEGPKMAEGFRSGIRHLVSAGIADADKVGLIAFSRTGYHLLHLLAQYPNLLVAANISDSVQVGYLAHLLATNAPPDFQSRLATMGAGAPDFAQVGRWFARNPTYSLLKTRTALRIEALGAESVLGLWELYALMRNADRPVDLIFFPNGSHVLQKPLEQLGSQQGNVDWFRFWLQGVEDPNPAKAEQYARWREMRMPPHRKQTKVHDDA